MDKTVKYFVKKNGKIDKEKTKKLKEMNKIFSDTMLAENYRGPNTYLRPLGRLTNDLRLLFAGKDEARAMRAARKVKATRVLRSLDRK